ncbi:MAG: TetR/AcrR family transcriptional regulator [Calditrichia bacterium]
MTESTREKLLQVAEKLIAQNGIGKTSLRQIVKEAGANIAAVNYHFGSKDDLMVAVYEQHFTPVNNERIRRLDLLEDDSDGQPVALEKLLDAFMMPVFEGKLKDPTERAHNLQLFSRIHTETPELRMKILNSFSDVLMRFVEAFQKTLPEHTVSEIFLRMKCSMGILMTLAMELPELSRLANSDEHKLDSEQLPATLISFAAAGFRAKAAPKPNQGDT